MSNSTVRARHRAQTAHTTTFGTYARSVGGNAGRQAAAVIAASGLVLTSGVAANAAEAGAAQTGTAVSGKLAHAHGVTVPAGAQLKFEAISASAKAAEVAKPAPAAVKDAAVIEDAAVADAAVTEAVPSSDQSVENAAISADRSAPAAETAATKQAQATAPAPARHVAATGAAPKKTAGTGTPTGSGSAIVSAAYAQLGVAQDCTALASNSLAAVGIHFHGWPADYQSLGRLVSQSEARPGDLIYYADGGAGAAHIAVYVGEGRAVHGGFEGTTKVFTVNVGSGPTSFIAIGH